MAREKGGPAVAAVAAVFYPLSWLCGAWQRVGLEHVPATGPVIAVTNHISYLDPVYTAVFVHRARRVPRFLAKGSLWQVPLLGTALRNSGQIPVRRGSADAEGSLRAAGEALDEGKLVVIYPEGTITRDPDVWPMSARTGVARLALAHDVPVIPMVHWNTHLVYDHYRKRFRPLPRRRVVMRAGPPVDLSAFRGREVTSMLLRTVTDHLMSAVRDELAAVRGEPAPTEFFNPSRDAG